MDVTIGGHINKPKGRGNTLPHEEISLFLDRHRTAKIVVVIDTHSLTESGRFVCGEIDDQSLESCTMWQVRTPFHMRPAGTSHIAS